MIKTKTFFGFILGVFLLGLGSGAMAQYNPLPPYDVQNVKAQVEGGNIVVTWDETQDQDGGIVIGYKIYYGTKSVQQGNGNRYDDEILIQDPQTRYTLTNLSEGKYYLAVTAIDDEWGESKNYSLETSVTIGEQAPEDRDTGSPKVRSVEQLSGNEIQVLMSEEVSLTAGNNSFLINDQTDFEEKSVIDVFIEGPYVFLTVSSDLVTGNTYEVVATSQVEDLEGNPVASGITDTAIFVATDQEIVYVSEEEDLLPELFDIPQEEVTDPLVIEPEESLPSDPAPETLPDPVREDESDFFGPELTPQQREQINQSVQEETPDTTPPMEVSNIAVDKEDLFQQEFVIVSWDKAPDTDGDIDDQIVYVRLKAGEWDEGYSIGKETDQVRLDVFLDEEYEVKIVSMDTSGNMSSGRVASFSTVLDLPKTGAGSWGLLGVVALVIGVIFVLYQRQRRLY